MSRFHVAGALPAGVEAVLGDLAEPDTLKPALVEVDAVFLLWPFLSAGGVRTVVNTIADHARRVVYVSALNVRDDRTPAENGVGFVVAVDFLPVALVILRNLEIVRQPVGHLDLVDLHRDVADRAGGHPCWAWSGEPGIESRLGRIMCDYR